MLDAAFEETALFRTMLQRLLGYKVANILDRPTWHNCIVYFSGDCSIPKYRMSMQDLPNQVNTIWTNLGSSSHFLELR